MKLIDWFKQRWAAGRPLPLDRKLAVEFDEQGARVHVIQRLSNDWEQSFRWDEVVKVCFKDMGLYASDMVFIHLRDKEKPVVIPTEARGGNELFAAICEKGFFPDHVALAAVRETNGGLHCWP